MMMALAAARDLPGVLIPGGVTLLAEEGEDAGKVQSIGARFAHGQMTLEARRRSAVAAPAPRPAAAASFWAPRPPRRWSAKRWACRCRIRALAPSGHPIWLDMARRSARAVLALEARGLAMGDILTPTLRCATPWWCTRPSAAPPT